jgi:hypothetical protein
LAKFEKGQARTSKPCSIDLDVETIATEMIFRTPSEGNENLKFLKRRDDLSHWKTRNKNPSK